MSALGQPRECSVDGCSGEHVARGYCGAHYMRWRRGKSMTTPIRAMLSPEERFWRSVDRRSPDECWLWTAATNGVGYGVFEVDGGRVYVHRFSYELHRGQIPTGMYVCHSCDTRACVNPAHLWLGTNADNLADMAAKGRSIHGARSPHAKLTKPQVRAIRRLYATGRHSQRELAIRFEVNQTNISFIVRRQTWRHS